MDAHEVSPDVVDVVPTEILEVNYKSGVKAELGNELTPTQVKDTPTVKWNADPNTFYTLVMIDPDAPSRKDPKFREILHWLVGNIPGNDITKGDTLFGYIGSGPPKDNGLHRYIFLLYKQNGKIEFKEKRVPNTSKEGRLNFSIRKFGGRYDLGHPIAGNLYQAQHDDYCAILHKQLSG